MKTKLINGRIYDGNGGKPFYGELAFADDTILAVGTKLDGEFDTVIDVGGKAICPGFIDTHSHSDLRILVDSAIPSKIRQGITTEVCGQDGVSMAPIPEEYSAKWRLSIAGLEGDDPSVNWVSSGAGEYMRRIEANKPIANYAYLCPHGNIRMEVMGIEARAATEEELCRIEQALRRELDAGAAGMSSGLIYIPCVYATTEEMIRLCRILKEYDRPFVVHQRMEFNDIMTSMQELADIVRGSGVHLHISHFKMGGRKNEPLRYEAFRLIEQLQTEGYEISFDQYPYGAGSTMLAACIPPWAHAGGTDKLLERMRDPVERARIKSDILNNDTVWDNHIEFCTPEGIVVSDVTKDENKKYLGKNIVEIGEMMGVDYVDAMLDLLLDENNIVGMIEHYGTEECITAIMKRPEMNACTDGLLGGKPHPRVYGAFPRILGKYSRDDGLFPLETAIYKMTRKPAEAMRIADRGVLAPGRKADIVVFNHDTVKDLATYENPRQYSVGIEYVFVNGIKVIEGDKVFEAAASGRIVRAGR